jgi:hypothetical protein
MEKSKRTNYLDTDIWLDRQSKGSYRQVHNGAKKSFVDGRHRGWLTGEGAGDYNAGRE